MFLVVPVTLSVMTGRTKAEVGARVQARRRELQLTPGQLVQQAQIDDKTLQKLENGTRWPQEKTRFAIEAVLRWTPGSIALIRAGEEPTPLSDNAEGPPAEAKSEGWVHATTLLWKQIVEVADVARDADGEIERAANKAVTVAVDVLPEMLIAVEPSTAALPLIREMSVRSMDSINRLRELRGEDNLDQGSRGVTLPRDDSEDGASTSSLERLEKHTSAEQVNIDDGGHGREKRW